MNKDEIIEVFKENIDKLDRSEFKEILKNLKDLNKSCDKYDCYHKNRWDAYSRYFHNGKSLAKKLVDDIFDKYPYPDKGLNSDISEMMKKIKYYAKTDRWQRMWDILKIF